MSCQSVVATNERLLSTFCCSVMFLFLSHSRVSYISLPYFFVPITLWLPKELWQCGVGGKSVEFQSC